MDDDTDKELDDEDASGAEEDEEDGGDDEEDEAKIESSAATPLRCSRKTNKQKKSTGIVRLNKNRPRMGGEGGALPIRVRHDAVYHLIFVDNLQYPDPMIQILTNSIARKKNQNNYRPTEIQKER